MSESGILSFGGKGQSHGLSHIAIGALNKGASYPDGTAFSISAGSPMGLTIDPSAVPGHPDAESRHTASYVYTDTLSFTIGTESISLTLSTSDTSHFGTVTGITGTAGGLTITPTANFATSTEFFDGSKVEAGVVISFETSQGTYELFGQGAGTGDNYKHAYDGNFSVIYTANGGEQTFYTFNTVDDIFSKEAVCYVAGTGILSPQGEVPVESLRAGSIVVTASGQQRRVKWVGHRTMRCNQLPDPQKAWPVRIAADAFGPGMPHSDLLVSPAHALRVSCVDDVLITAKALINGGTIAQVPMNKVSYWHVELESHDILMANGMPAESYLEMDNRHFFVEAGAVSLHAVPDAGVRTQADMCLPFVGGGEIVTFARTRLQARAERLGWTADREVGLHLLVDGDRIDPVYADGAALFQLPASAQDVRICSTSFCPRDMGATDQRRLGVNISGLSLLAGNGDARVIPLGDARLNDGWYWLETGAANKQWRWTKGEAALHASFWQDLQGDMTLRVAYGAKALRGWHAPKVEVRATRAA